MVGSSWVKPALSMDKCALLKDNIVNSGSLEPASPWFLVEHSTTELLPSQSIAWDVV